MLTDEQEVSLLPQHTTNTPLQTQELYLPWSEAETSLLKSKRRAVKLFMTGCCWVTWGACVKFPSGKTYICFLFSMIPLSWDFITTLDLCPPAKSVKIERLQQFPENTNIHQHSDIIKIVSKSFECRAWNIGKISFFLIPFLPKKYVYIVDWEGKSENALLISQ